MKNLIIYESSIKYGPLSLNKEYYPNELGYSDRVTDYKRRLDCLAKDVGFAGNKILIPIQKSVNKKFYYPDNSCVKIDKDLASNENLWHENIYGDYAILSGEYPKVSLASRVADCPVVILYDEKNEVSLLGHCGAEYINRELPIAMVNKLKDLANCELKNIQAYISSCISFKNYAYDNYPTFATNKEVWKNSIFQSGKQYYINLRKAIYEQLKHNGIYLTNMYFNPADSFSSDHLYSNRAYKLGDVRKRGRYLVGCYYK